MTHSWNTVSIGKYRAALAVIADVIENVQHHLLMALCVYSRGTE